jgi:FKBP-type peptidyl-prolyl cis-trans isomerase 2
MSKIKTGDNVQVNYTGKLEDGSIFDTSIGRQPLDVKIGEGQLIKGFENALINMSIGEIKTIMLEPSDAYGKLNPEMIAEVEKSQISDNVSVGDVLQGHGPMGPINVKVVEIKESTIVVDANHPLSGKKLIFDLEIVSVN